MIHRGELVKKTVKQKKISVNDLAEQIGMSRTNIYKLFVRRDMPANYIYRIGEVIDVDFTQLIPGLNKELVDLKGKELSSQKPAEYVAEAPAPYMLTQYEVLDINVHLDGTENTLERVFEKLRKVNQILKMA